MAKFFQLIGFLSEKGPLEYAGTKQGIENARAEADKLVADGKYYGVGVRPTTQHSGPWSYLTADIQPEHTKVPVRHRRKDGGPKLPFPEVKDA